VNESEIAKRPDELNGAPGKLLAAAREAQNLSVAEVARQLKLTVHQVEGLETGEYERLPGPVFVRGFIRNYARFVKLDPEQLVNSAAKSLPHQESRPPAPPSQDIPFPTVAPRRWPKYAAAIAAAVAALSAYEFYFSEPPTAGTSSVTVPPPTAAPAPQPSAPAVAESAPATTGAPSQGGRTESPPARAPAGAAASGQDAPPVASRIALQDKEALSQHGVREVRMVFDQESWVEIRDRNGKAIFSQLNHRGTEQRVNGRPPLSVIVGNARGVRLTYDDQPVDLARHTKIDVARFHLE
jgi:cytoskeleton protein RodZ